MAPKSDSEPDWQLECGEIKHRGARLLQTGQWSDCAFLVGPGPDQVTFNAHKLVLAMASPVFEAMFYGSISDGNHPIPIPDMHPDAFKKFLVYVYTDNIELNSFTSARDLYYGAHKYMLLHLMKVCARYLSRTLSPQTAGLTYEFAELVGNNKLMEESLEFIRLETMAVLKHRTFNKLAIGTVLKVFQTSPLNINSELDLFAAAERYARALDKRNGDDQEEADDIDDVQNQLTLEDKVKVKCRNLIANLLELAVKEKTSVRLMVRSLIQKLIDAQVEPEEFCDTLEHLLKARTHPWLIRFLKKSLPYLRQSLAAKELMIEGIKPPIVNVAPTISVPVPPAVPNIETVSDTDVENNNEELKASGSGENGKITKEINNEKLNLESSIFANKEWAPLIRNLLYQIRFLTLSVKEFAEYKTFSSLLTESEILALLMNIGSSETHIPMPSGFSTCRESRKRSSKSNVHDNNLTVKRVRLL